MVVVVTGITRSGPADGGVSEKAGLHLGNYGACDVWQLLELVGKPVKLLIVIFIFFYAKLHF